MLKRTSYISISLLLTGMLSFVASAQQPSVYKVERLSFNSELFNDISPVIVNDGVIFCSDRRLSAFKDRTAYDGHRLYNIFIAKKSESPAWSDPKEIKNERSSLFNNGPLCIAADGKTVYFTSDVETGRLAKKRDYKNHSGIFIADMSGDELLSVRPFKYNNSEYDVGQPSISRDGKYLFFSSDMPGGQGGSDIYYCEFINGEWSAPVNMGTDVNSVSSENYPYIHPSGRLYFSSRREGGMGKLDVYYTIMNKGSWEQPVLLPEPINSSSDDFAFVAGENLQTGYFSSNRGKNDDIYSFQSTIIRKESCNPLEINSYCYRFLEENAVKFDTMPFRYEWKFGDGNSSIGPVVEHCYESPGTYLVQLDVVNLITKEVMYNEKSDTLVITAVEQPYISAPDRVISGNRIMLSADSTNLPGWKIASYYWNFGDETIALGTNVDKTYLKPGTYNIQLILSAEPEPGGLVRDACVSKNIIVMP